VSPRRPPPDLSDLAPWLEAFRNESDRAAAVLGGALLDELLSRLFRARLTADANPDLLRERGALGSFAARIDIAYALGWLSPVERDDLHILRGIRNDFAHAVEHTLTFEDQSIADRTRNLKLPLRVLAAADARVARGPQSDPNEFAAQLARDLRERARRRFATAVAVIAGRIGQAIDESVCAAVADEPWGDGVRDRSY
jgi:hypothetical protein